MIWIVRKNGDRIDKNFSKNLMSNTAYIAN